MTHRAPHTVLFLLAACSGGAGDAPAPTDTAPTGWPQGVWNPGLPEAESLVAPAGQVWRRGVFHLHSPWSHDACDGRGYEEGVVDEACLADLRAALCTLSYDAAWLTDHPDHASAQPFEALLHPQPDDTVLDGGALSVPCEATEPVTWFPGFEDSLMPVGLERHVDPDPATRHTLLNQSDAAAVAAMEQAGAHVLMAHTEGKAVDDLIALQDAGLHGVEAYNVHAMMAPDIREADLGLDGGGWLLDVGPFLDTEGTAGPVPDLLFLAVHQEQTPSIEAWDALLARGPMMATAGSDAHQNVLPLPLSDGERVDSYRRILRWFSTFLLADSSSVDDLEAAVEARRAAVVFEALGTPDGLGVAVVSDDGTRHEMGAWDVPAGELVVDCPTLADGSPRGADDPGITAVVYKDGEPWQTGCGTWEAGPGVYRVRFDLVPHHLRPFLGELADGLMRPFPWIYTGAIAVR